MFVNNPIDNDPRVKREAKHLVCAGYEVTVIGKPAPGLPRHENWEGVHFWRVSSFLISFYQLIKRKLLKPSFIESNKGKRGFPGKGLSNHGLVNLFRIWISELCTVLTLVTAGLFLRADIYHAHDLDRLLCAYLCAKITRRKLVYDSHELWLEWQRSRSKNSSILWWWEIVEERAGLSADLVVTVSNGIAEELKRLYGIPEPLVIRNCAPLMPIVRSNRLRELIKGDKNRPIFLYQGGFCNHRGLEELIAAANYLPDADFVLMGRESAYKDKIKKLANEANNNNVFVMPKVPLEDLWIFTCNANAGFVLTQPYCLSYELSESNKLYEYMAARIPIIASSIESHKRLYRETNAIKLVNPYSPRDIARAAKELLENPEQAKEMGNQSRLWAENRYNTSYQMEKLCKAYDRLFLVKG